MRIETVAVLAKGACFMVIGGLTPLASGLSQWIEGGTIPPINWIVIIAGCCVGAATQVLAFLSQSFGNYKLEMKSTENGSTLQSKTVTVETKNEPAVPVEPPK